MSKEIRDLIRGITQSLDHDGLLSTGGIIEELKSKHPKAVAQYEDRLLRMGLERLVNEVVRQTSAPLSGLPLFPELRQLSCLVTIVGVSSDGKPIRIRKPREKLTIGDLKQAADTVQNKRVANKPRNPYEDLLFVLNHPEAADHILVADLLPKH